jgi:hypothetical protein
VHREARIAGEPAFYSRRLVRREIVEHDVDRKILGDSLVDQDEEFPDSSDDDACI